MRLLSPEEAARHPAGAPQLTRSLGASPGVQIDLTRQPVEDGDVLVLCSDGLWDLVSRAEMVDAVNTSGTGTPAQTLTDAIVELAVKRGASDNVTAAVVTVTSTLPFPAAGGRRLLPPGADLMRLSPGSHVDQFEIVEALGEGTYTETYKARDTTNGRLVVLKCFDPNLFADPHNFQRFRREAQIVATPRSSERGAQPRRGAQPHRAVPRARVHRRAEPAPARQLPRPGRTGGDGTRLGPTARRRARVPPHARHRPPGPQARERADQRRRPAADHGLRHRDARRRQATHVAAPQREPRDARLHEPRADQGRSR